MKVYLATAAIFGAVAIAAAFAPKAVADEYNVHLSTRSVVGSEASVHVPYADLNLANPSGAEIMLGRIDAAARAVCDPGDTRQLVLHKLAQSCERDAVERAVADLGQPLVVALYQERIGHVEPSQIAAADVAPAR